MSLVLCCFVAGLFSIAQFLVTSAYKKNPELGLHFSDFNMVCLLVFVRCTLLGTPASNLQKQR